MSEQPAVPHEPVRAADGSSAVATLARVYAEHARSLDVEGLLELYTTDAVVADLTRTTAYRGVAEWRTGVAEWFGSLDADQVNLAQFGEIDVLLESDGVASAYVVVRYAVESPEGVASYQMHNRLTWVVVRGDDGGWRIAHEHTSVAIDMDTGTAIIE